MYICETIYSRKKEPGYLLSEGTVKFDFLCLSVFGHSILCYDKQQQMFYCDIYFLCLDRTDSVRAPPFALT